MGKESVRRPAASGIPRAALAGLAVIAAASSALAALGRFAEHPLGAAIAFSIAGCAWLAAVRATRDLELDLRWVFVGAIVLRAIALASSLALSDDVERYVWEGEVCLHGISPYGFAPAAPELASIRAEWPVLASGVAHPTISAAYPPLVQAVGILAALVARALALPPEVGGVGFLRVLFAVCDILVLVPLLAILRRLGLPSGRAVVWAWCPLLSFEFAGSGHFDSLGVLLLMSALAAFAGESGLRARLADVLGGIALGGAIVVKYIPLVVLPWIGRGPRGVARAVAALTLGLLAFIPLLYLEGAEHGFFGGVTQYGLRWESTNLVFRFVEGLCARFFEPAPGWRDPHRVARLAVGAAWLAWAVWVRVRETDRVRGVALLIAGFLVLTPTLHPWYLAWVAAFVAIAPSAAWLWLLAAAPLLYAPLAGWQSRGEWVEPLWLWPIVAVPFWVLLLRSKMRAA
jgi:hypothetical protein